MAGNIFDLVRFIEDDGRIFGQDAAERLIAHGQIRKEQVVINDDDVAFERAAVHLGDEAAVELFAFLARAEVASRIELPPGRARFGKIAQFAAIARGGDLLPIANDLKFL